MKRKPSLTRLLPMLGAWILGIAGQCHGEQSGGSRNMLLADHTTRQLFLYSEEKGIVWKKEAKGLFDAWVLEDGSIVYTTNETAERITPNMDAGEGGKIDWVYRYGTGFPPEDGKLPKGQIYTCGPLPGGGFLVTESGTFRLVELDDRGKPGKVIKIPRTGVEIRYALRLARRSPEGRYYVPYFGDGKIAIFDAAGTQVDSIDVNKVAGIEGNSAYETFFSGDGELLISCGPANQIVRLDKDRKVVWRLKPDDVAPAINLDWITSLQPGSNGNIIVCNYCKGNAKVRAFEIGMDKKILWELRDAGPEIKGLTRIQMLDEQFKPIGKQGG